MTITREQVADLQPGDVVEVVETIDGDDFTTRGPLRASEGGESLTLGDFSFRAADGAPAKWFHTLTVVSRAPRPLYVNHPRTEPVAGDVVSRGDKDGAAWSYCPRPVRGMGNRWRNTANDEWFADEDFLDFGNGLRLLVDGETGTVVQP